MTESNDNKEKSDSLCNLIRIFNKDETRNENELTKMLRSLIEDEKDMDFLSLYEFAALKQFYKLNDAQEMVKLLSAEYILLKRFNSLKEDAKREFIKEMDNLQDGTVLSIALGLQLERIYLKRWLYPYLLIKYTFINDDEIFVLYKNYKGKENQDDVSDTKITIKISKGKDIEGYIKELDEKIIIQESKVGTKANNALSGYKIKKSLLQQILKTETENHFTKD